MVTAFVLIKIQRDRIHDASQEILDIDGVTEVHSVAGDCDLVAVVRVRENEQLANLITENMIAVKGIVDMTTLIAFSSIAKMICRTC